MSCLDLKESEKAEELAFRDDEPDVEIPFWCSAGHATEKSKK